MDATNPLDFSAGPPRLFVGHEDSLGEQLQRAAPGARVVKAYNRGQHPHGGQEAAERDREARIRAERASAEAHTRAEAAETLSAAHQDSARRADEARHGAEVRADAAERVAADERQRATTMADLLRQAQEAEAASRRRADVAERD